MSEKTVEIFTDGGCWGNPGPGGWGVILRCNDHEKSFSGSEAYTTNNRMEMTAAIEGLALLKHKCKVTITTDSTYLKDGITKWIEGWKKNGWKTKERSLVKNIDLWKRLDTLVFQHDVTWEWIKGHDGHRENERADSLAQTAIKSFLRRLDIVVPDQQFIPNDLRKY
jgi:ribonuclease HI